MYLNYLKKYFNCVTSPYRQPISERVLHLMLLNVSLSLSVFVFVATKVLNKM